MNKKILAAHKKHNDLKGTDRRILAFSGKDLYLKIDTPKKEVFGISKYKAINWIAHDIFTISETNQKVEFEKIKGISLNYDAKEQKADTERIRINLVELSNSEKYVYIVYFIGGNRDIIVTDVNTLTEKEYNSL